MTGFTHVFLLSDPLFEPETPDAVVLPTAPLLEVYPNPAEGMLRVEGMQSVERMRLVNLVGQEVKVWNNLPALGSLVLDIEGVQPGIHLLVGESAAGESVVTRVVVR